VTEIGVRTLCEFFFEFLSCPLQNQYSLDLAGYSDRRLILGITATEIERIHSSRFIISYYTGIVAIITMQLL
jgi:hypothetical protein